MDFIKYSYFKLYGLVVNGTICSNSTGIDNMNRDKYSSMTFIVFAEFLFVIAMII